MLLSTRRTLLLAGLLCLLPAGASAQDCSGDTYWSNDTLPQNPVAVPLTIGVIQGLCEGEAAAQVFTLPGGSGPQKINKVSVGYGAPLGASGFVATCNIEIYDGITWAGGIPTLGTKVFDLSADLGLELKLTSTAILEQDLSTENIVVGNGTSAFVVAFRMSFNPEGSCLAGYTASFFTDGPGGGGCSTTPMTSLIDIAGQGWRDASTASVGVPLCPTFYDGNWVIRACTADATDGSQFIDLGFGLTGTFAPSLSGSGSMASGETFTLTFAGQPPSRTAFLFLDVVTLFAPFKGGTLVPGTTFLIPFPTPATAFDLTEIPLVLTGVVPSDVSLYWQAWYPDVGGPAGFSATNGLETITP